LDKNRLASAELIKRVEDAGFKAIMLTVDAPVPGNRELDRRTQLGDFSVCIRILFVVVSSSSPSTVQGPAHGKSSNGGGGVANVGFFSSGVRNAFTESQRFPGDQRLPGQ
jgi:hypothetical protein